MKYRLFLTAFSIATIMLFSIAALFAAEITFTWTNLRGLNSKTGQMTAELRQANGKKVRIPGFMVPLDDMSYNMVKEFILVPNPLACIHVPPPPPNQMVYVKMQKQKAQVLFGRPIWVYGTLKITATKSPFGKVSYQLLADKTTKYTR